MNSVAYVHRLVQRLFEEDAPRLARQAGMRQRKVSFTHLALLLVLGWWQQPRSGPSALARFAGGLGETLSKQAIDDRWSPRMADWLLALLQQAVQYVVSRQTGFPDWMKPFPAVWAEDGSSIPLPESLATVWRGCGGRRRKDGQPGKTEAAVKAILRIDVKGGQWHGPCLQDGRRHEACSPVSTLPMTKGSLWLADLGYWSLLRLKTLMQQGIYFCLRLKLYTVLWYQKQRTDVLTLIESLPPETQQAEWQVHVGAGQQVKDVRLLVQRVPETVLAQRQERIREYARKHSKPVNALAMQLAGWNILVTNLPASLVSLSQAFVLIKARWQIELVFKLWKQHALLDEWTSENPWRILCEVYAKLLAMVVQHWLMLLTCEEDPNASWVEVAEILREQVAVLVHGFARHLPLGKAIRLVVESVQGGCSIEARSTRLNTSRLIQSAFDRSLS